MYSTCTAVFVNQNRLYQRWADHEIFQSGFSPVPMKLHPIQSWSAKFLKIISPIQSWSARVKMYFYFASWGKTTTGAILPLAKYDWLKAKYFQQCFCPMRQNRHSLLAFPKFNKEVSTRHQREKYFWSYSAISRIRLLGLLKWQMDIILGLA